MQILTANQRNSLRCYEDKNSCDCFDGGVNHVIAIWQFINDIDTSVFARKRLQCVIACDSRRRSHFHFDRIKSKFMIVRLWIAIH